MKIRRCGCLQKLCKLCLWYCGGLSVLQIVAKARASVQGMKVTLVSQTRIADSTYPGDVDINKSSERIFRCLVTTDWSLSEHVNDWAEREQRNIRSPLITYFYNHRSAPAHTTMKVLGMIKRTIRFKDMRVMLSLYKSLVRPHVEYCISAWNPHYKKDKELIEKCSEEIYKDD